MADAREAGRSVHFPATQRHIKNLTRVVGNYGLRGIGAYSVLVETIKMSGQAQGSLPDAEQHRSTGSEITDPVAREIRWRTDMLSRALHQETPGMKPEEFVPVLIFTLTKEVRPTLPAKLNF